MNNINEAVSHVVKGTPSPGPGGSLTLWHTLKWAGSYSWQAVRHSQKSQTKLLSPSLLFSLHYTLSLSAVELWSQTPPAEIQNTMFSIVLHLYFLLNYETTHTHTYTHTYTQLIATKHTNKWMNATKNKCRAPGQLSGLLSPTWRLGLSRYAYLLGHFRGHSQSHVSLCRWRGDNIFTHPHLGVLEVQWQSSSHFWLFWLLSYQKRRHWADRLKQVSLRRFLLFKVVVGCWPSAHLVRLGDSADLLKSKLREMRRCKKFPLVL